MSASQNSASRDYTHYMLTGFQLQEKAEAARLSFIRVGSETGTMLLKKVTGLVLIQRDSLHHYAKIKKHVSLGVNKAIVYCRLGNRPYRFMFHLPSFQCP